MFSETKVGQVSDFMRYTGFELVPVEDFYTFAQLEDAPNFSLAGKPFLDFPAIATHEGKPWQVFQANECVFNFVSGLVVPISSIVNPISLFEAGNRFVSKGLIQPGSVYKARIVSGFDGWFSRDSLNWVYSEVSFVENT
jgi:hypothetical protein